jgi:hypothetical protein
MAPLFLSAIWLLAAIHSSQSQSILRAPTWQVPTTLTLGQPLARVAGSAFLLNATTAALTGGVTALGSGAFTAPGVFQQGEASRDATSTHTRTHARTLASTQPLVLAPPPPRPYPPPLPHYPPLPPSPSLAQGALA